MWESLDFNTKGCSANKAFHFVLVPRTLWSVWRVGNLMGGIFATVTIRNGLSLPLVLSMVLTTPCFKLLQERLSQRQKKKSTVLQSSPVAFSSHGSALFSGVFSCQSCLAVQIRKVLAFFFPSLICWVWFTHLFGLLWKAKRVIDCDGADAVKKQKQIIKHTYTGENLGVPAAISCLKEKLTLLYWLLWWDVCASSESDWDLPPSLTDSWLCRCRTSITKTKTHSWFCLNIPKVGKFDLLSVWEYGCLRIPPPVHQKESMFTLFIGTNIETSVPPCLTARLRGLQEAWLCLAADKGWHPLRKVSGMEGRPWPVGAPALGLIFSALTLNTRQPACYRLLGSAGGLREMLIRVGFAAWHGLSVPAGRRTPPTTAVQRRVNNLFGPLCTVFELGDVS